LSGSGGFSIAYYSIRRFPLAYKSSTLPRLQIAEPQQQRSGIVIGSGDFSIAFNFLRLQIAEPFYMT